MDKNYKVTYIDNSSEVISAKNKKEALQQISEYIIENNWIKNIELIEEQTTEATNNIVATEEQIENKGTYSNYTLEELKKLNDTWFPENELYKIKKYNKNVIDVKEIGWNKYEAYKLAKIHLIDNTSIIVTLD